MFKNRFFPQTTNASENVNITIREDHPKLIMSMIGKIINLDLYFFRLTSYNR